MHLRKFAYFAHPFITHNTHIMAQKIKQKGYGNIEIDNTEKDILQVWYFEKNESNVVQVRRENIPLLIHLLTDCVEKGHEKVDNN